MACNFEDLRKLFDRTLISDEQLQEFMDEVNKIYEFNGGHRSDDLVKDHIARRVDTYVTGVLGEMRNEFRTKLEADKMVAHIRSRPNDESNASIDAMLAIFEGTNRNDIQGGRNSIGVQATTMIADLMNQLSTRLNELGVINAFKRGTMNRDIMVELHELKPGGQFGKTGNKKAMEVARVVHSINDQLVLRLRAAGIPVNRLEGYIMKQSHDPDVLAKAGYEAWVEDIWSRLDHRRTFGANANDNNFIDSFLRQAYDDITGENYGLTGTKDMFHRKLHFKDGNAFYEYNQKYGTTDLATAIMRSIEVNSREIALAERVGTDPEETLKALKKAAEENIPGPQRKQFRHDFQAVEDALSVARGVHHDRARGIVARTAKGLRIMNNLSLLSEATTILSFGDLAIAASKLVQLNGGHIIGRFAQLFVESMSNLRPSERKKWLIRAGEGLSDLNASFFTRFNQTDGVMPSGLMSSAQAGFFRLTFLQTMTEAFKGAHAKILLRELTEDWSGTRFGDLPFDWQRTFGFHEIGPMQWELMRQATEELNGQKFVSPEAVEKASDDLVSKVMKETGFRSSVDLFRKETARRFRGFINERTQKAIITPGAKEQRLLLGGQSINTGKIVNPTRNLVTQFMSFPLTMMSSARQTVNDSMPTGVNRRRDVFRHRSAMQNYVKLLTATTVTAYLSKYVTDWARGREPDDLSDPETWVRMIARGGAGGIYADYILNDYDGNWRTPLKDAAGPSLVDLNDARILVGDAVRGEAEFKDATKLLKDNMPGSNSIFVQQIIMGEFLADLADMDNPGYSDRLLNNSSQFQGGE